MPANKLNEDKFDQMLSRTLRQHIEPVPADFANRISQQIREAEEQAVLARVAMKERFALASCIALGTVSIVMAISFPGAASTFIQQFEAFISKISQIPKAVTAVGWGWQHYAVVVGVFAFAIYNFADLLAGDSQ